MNAGVLLLGAAGVFPSPAEGQTCPAATFGTPITKSLGTNLPSIVAADFNADGRADVAVSDASMSSVWVLLGAGDGTFGAPRSFAVGPAPFVLGSGDFNADGKPDLAAANRDGNSVSVLMARGDGTFDAAQTMAVGKLPLGLAAADLNGDGRADLAVSNVDSDDLTVLLATPAGGFSLAGSFPVALDPRDVAIGDLDRDGKPDVVVAGYGANTFSVLLGTGTGGFAAAQSFSAGSGPFGIALGDWNGDGSLDVVVSGFLDGGVRIHLGDGRGAFVAKASYLAAPKPRNVAPSDLNLDGRLDFAVSSAGGLNVPVFTGTGAGLFTRALWPAGIDPGSVAVADFNRDGKPDLAAANQVFPSSSVSVLLNTTQPCISIDDRTVGEGSAVNAAFRAFLSSASTSTVTVQYQTANDTAVSGSDYAATSETLTFTPGRTLHSIFVPIVTDTTVEGNETFFVNLSSPSNATLSSKQQGIGTITDPPTAAKAAMYRSYNKSTDYHFFTTDLNSKNFAVGTLGFQDESTPVPFYVWNAEQSGTVPLFRMYNPNLGRHFYTASSGSRDFIMSIGGVYEKEEGFVFPLGTSPVPSGATELFLLYNSNSGTHLFTADAGQKDAILSMFQGIWVQHTSVGFVFTSP